MRSKRDNNAQRDLPSSAFQVWMGQWRLTTLDTEGCLFVLRFLLRSFSSRRSDDRFWKVLREFLFSDQVEHDSSIHSAKELLTYAGSLKPDQARALVSYLGECYAAESDRQFWLTIGEAVQLYTVAPYSGRAAGSA